MRLLSIIIVIVSVILSIGLYYCTNANQHSGVIQRIKDSGYPFETHTVETKDGYILTLFRIPYDNYNVYKNKTRTPVLIMHGLLSSSTDFFAFDTNGSLPYLLADQGYDVWLANARGSTWSRKHKVLNPDVDKQEYFNFSWHEIGVIDLPTLIDYVLDTTKQKQLQYIGASQGTATMLVLLSEMPEYNKKIILLSAISPGVFMGETVCPIIAFLGKNAYTWEKVLSFLGIYEMTSDDGFVSKYLKYTCRKDSMLMGLCLEHLKWFSGPWYEQAEGNIIERFVENFPAGSSIKQLTHYFQVCYTNEFLKFDYGEYKNLEMYQQTTPPLYDFKKATLPIAVYYSRDDWLMTQHASERLIKLLPNVVKTTLIEETDFNHGCFMACSSAKELVYKPLIEEMKKY